MPNSLRCWLIASLVGMVHGNAFRGNGPTRALRVTGRMKADDLRATMLDELMAALGSGSRVTDMRLQKIEHALRPIFQSLPKNEHGHLEHSAARYALHRVFVLRHGMYIKGLEPGVDATGSLSATEVLSDRVPEFLQTAFEQRLSGRGLGMHEVAILAATMEHVIHDHAAKILQLAYKVQSLPVEAQLTTRQVQHIIDTYMILFMRGLDSETITFADIQPQWLEPEAFYPAWRESKKFTQEVLKEVMSANVAKPEFADGRLTFNAVAQVVEEIGERFGRFQDAECKDLKAVLMKMEEPGTGRVLLKNFYGDALKGNFAFTESRSYLQESGVLDDTNAGRESVVIANYINSASNCVASTGVYSVCCINECEGLLGHLEKEIAQPEAAPSQIIELVTNLPSSTVPAPRGISSRLKSRLQEIADHHHGRIPLHGRLFGQWMHHAYPRECPYPIKTNTTAGYVSGTGILVSQEEMEFHAAADVNETFGGEVQELMWTTEEELIVSAKPPATSTRSTSFTCLAAILSICFVAFRLYGSSKVKTGKSLLPMSHKEHCC